MPSMSNAQANHKAGYDLLHTMPVTSSTSTEEEMVEFTTPLVQHQQANQNQKRKKRRMRRPYRNSSNRTSSQADVTAIRPSDGSTGCTLWATFQTFLFVVILLSGVGLAYWSFQLHERLDNVSEFLQTVQSYYSDLNKQMSTLQSKVLYMETTMNDTLAGRQGLTTIRANITDILEQIRLLNTSVLRIKTSLDGAPPLKELPTEVKSLQLEVADQGSRLDTLQGAVKPMDDFQQGLDSLRHQFQAELDGIKKTLSQVTPLPSVSSGITQDQYQQIVTKFTTDLTAMNESVMQQIDLLNSTISPRPKAPSSPGFPDVPEISLLQRNISLLRKEFETFRDTAKFDLNNNLLNPDTVRGMQEVFRRTFEQFKLEHNISLRYIDDRLLNLEKDHEKFQLDIVLLKNESSPNGMGNP